jgi:hypothetical protein
LVAMRPVAVKRLEFVVARFAIVVARFHERVPTVEVREVRLELVVAREPESEVIFAVIPESEVLRVAIVPERAFCARRSVK